MHQYTIDSLKLCEDEIEVKRKMIEVVKRFPETFSQSVSVNTYGSSIWITVYNREDLQAFLTLAPRWDKNTSGKRIRYLAKVNDIEIEIFAADAALPPTCKVIVETVVVPATEERTTTVERIVCDV